MAHEKVEAEEERTQEDGDNTAPKLKNLLVWLSSMKSLTISTSGSGSEKSTAVVAVKKLDKWQCTISDEILQIVSNRSPEGDLGVQSIIRYKKKVNETLQQASPHIFAALVLSGMCEKASRSGKNRIL